MLLIEKNILTLKKWNSKKSKFEIFKEGDKNTRPCNKGCMVCGKPIEVGEGYRLVTTASYEFIHTECRHDLIASSTVESKTTIIPFSYEIIVYGKENVVHTLIMNEWVKKANNIVAIELNNLNPLKVIDALHVSKLIVTITNKLTEESKKVIVNDNLGIVAHKLIDNISIQLGKYKY